MFSLLSFIKFKFFLLGLEFNHLLACILACYSYEDLIKHYEEDGMGDELFSQILLFAAYMNSNVKDGLMMKCALWTPQRQLSRMMIIGCKDGVDQSYFL